MLRALTMLDGHLPALGPRTLTPKAFLSVARLVHAVSWLAG